MAASLFCCTKVAVVLSKNKMTVKHEAEESELMTNGSFCCSCPTAVGQWKGALQFGEGSVSIACPTIVGQEA